MKQILALLAALLLCMPVNAFAGDGATVIFASGTVVYINNGYAQLVSSLKEFNRKGSENYVAEVNIEGSTFFINLDDVAVVCRDKCNSMEIREPAKK